jgi:cyclophilin family peptidyl-prolyl cis-trans isomerase
MAFLLTALTGVCCGKVPAGDATQQQKHAKPQNKTRVSPPSPRNSNAKRAPADSTADPIYGPFGSRLAQLPLSQRPIVRVTTNLGTFWIVLFPKQAPATVANFLQYIKQKYYDGTVFHRTIPQTLIQAGAYLADMQKKKAGPPIYCEARNGLSNLRGTVAMARLVGEPDSARSQFFINLADNLHFDHRGPKPLEYGYAVFGRVFAGMAKVDEIGQVETTRRKPFAQDVPRTPVVIQSIRRIR